MNNHICRILGHFLMITMLSSGHSLAVEVFVCPSEVDQGDGSEERPFGSLREAQRVARKAIETATTDVFVNLVAGVYRLDAPLTFTPQDSGRNGHRVVYRSIAGPGKARIVGSRPLRGWQRHNDQIWKISIAEGWVFHMLYENGQRVHKARFPNLDRTAGMTCALGRYLVTENGSPELTPEQDSGWIVYRPTDALPTTGVQQMKIAVFPWGKCNWHRYNYAVQSIDPTSRRLTFDAMGCRTQILGRARFFLEDELAFLDAPGEFYLDETSHTLYYLPIGSGHPDQLNVTAPRIKTLLRIEGPSSESCVEKLSFVGLALEETDDLSPVLAWWNQGWGAEDHALVWMRNAADVEIRQCHLRNSGRSGIMMVGQNSNHLVEGCWIDRMGVNGVTLSNRFVPPDGKTRTKDRCRSNTIRNCRIHDVGQLHIYASCVNVMNASDNEIAYCELYNSSRYAITMRGNTNAQHVTPHTFTRHPPARGNRFHHLRIHHCGQDSGDMGAIHTATLNIPGGDCVNEFEQITIADTRAIPSMQDIPPDGIFLDWPFKSMHQTFRHVHIERSQGRQIRGNGAENVESATTENVSWSPDFSEALMDYGNIGVTSEFPAAFGGRAAPRAVPAPPQQLTASAPEWNRVTLKWQPPNHEFSCEPKYFVYRDAKKIAVTQRPQWNDISLNESTTHRYSIAVSDGEFAPLSESSSVCEIRTPLDRSSPRLVRAAVQRSAKRIRVVFDKPIDAVSAGRVENWTSKPPLRIQDVRPITATCVEITVDEMKEPTSYQISAKNVVDRTRSRNPVISDRWIPLKIAVGGVRYSMAQTENGDLLDESGGGHDACLHGTAVVEPMGGPGGTAALAIGNEGGYAEANANLDFGEGDFTLMAWIWKATPGSTVILSRGNGFGASDQWSWGWEKDGAPGSISLRANNRYFATAPDSVPLYRWVHVAFVRKGNTGQSYVNGSPSGDACDMAHVGSLANDQPLRIGRRSYEANPAYFRGKIASVRIVPLAVSPEEIRTEWEESKQ